MSRSYWKRDASVRPGAWNMALFVLGVAVCLLLLGQVLIGEMLSKTRGLNWVTPAGSPSILSEEHARRLFPARMRGGIALALEAAPEAPAGAAMSEVVAAFSRNVSARVHSDRRVSKFNPVVIGYFLEMPGGSQVHQLLRRELVSEDGRMTIIFIQPTKLAGNIDQANTFLQEFCDSPPPGFTLHITGMPSIMSGNGCFNSFHAKVDTKNLNFELIAKAEACTIPIAMLIIGSMVMYVRLLLLPLILVFISFIVTAALTVPWMDAIPIAHDVPAAVSSVTVAICLDSSLFFLSTFSEQHTAGWPLQQNVDAMTRSIGHTIAVSGTLVSIAFFGSMVLPEANLQGSGFCMGVATISCVLTSILLMPSLLLVLGKALTGTVFRNKHLQPVELSGYGGEAREEFEEAPDPVKLQREREMRGGESHWLTMMRLIDKSPFGAIVTVMLLMTPVFAFLPELNISGDRFGVMPMEMPALQALRRLQRDFPVGILEPFAVVVTAPGLSSAADLATELQAATAIAGLGGAAPHLASLAEEAGLRRGLPGLDASEASVGAAAKTAEEALGKAGSLSSSPPASPSRSPAIAAAASRAEQDLGITCAEYASAYAAGAGAAVVSSAPSQSGVGSEDVLAIRSAVHAAASVGCGEEATREALASALGALKERDELRKLASGKREAAVVQGGAAAAVREVVRLEAMRLGFSETSASHFASASPGATAEAMAKAGEAPPPCSSRAAASAGAAYAAASADIGREANSSSPGGPESGAAATADGPWRAAVAAAAATASVCGGAEAPEALRSAVAAAAAAASAPTLGGTHGRGFGSSGRQVGAGAMGPIREGVTEEAVVEKLAKLGLAPESAKKLAAAAREGAGKAAAAEEAARAAECATVAAVAAAAASGLGEGIRGGRGRGEEGDKAMEAARRLANATGCSEVAIRHALERAEEALQRRRATKAADAEILAAERSTAGGASAASNEAAGPEELMAKSLEEAKRVSAAALAGKGASVEAMTREGTLPTAEELIDTAAELSAKEHGSLLLPSGYAAMLDLCDRLQSLGEVASMLGPTWALHRRIDWLSAVALSAAPATRQLYRPMLDGHVSGSSALLEVHTKFPSVGAGGSNFVVEVRRILEEWEVDHPNFRAELSGGASEAADTRSAVLGAMGRYLLAIVPLIMGVVFLSFGSAIVPLRLAFALFFTLAATYGAGVIIYQTPLLHAFFPWLADFHGLTYEVVPMITGIAIALGLDYDIFLVSRIYEFRKQGFSDRAAIFRGASKAGGVISGAGIIMSLAFSGLAFSDKLFMQQLGVLLVISVLFDTYVVRTILVPALMLVSEEWNWWPKEMPPGIQTSLEGEVDEVVGSHYSPLLGS